jgi:hypothetical protein
MKLQSHDIFIMENLLFPKRFKVSFIKIQPFRQLQQLKSRQNSISEDYVIVDFDMVNEYHTIDDNILVEA